jgi:hypothetical protein
MIDQPDFKIIHGIIPVTGSGIFHLDISENLKTLFLPVGVADVFPNLEYYSAANCSIKEVSYLNFRGLSKLTVLELSDNFIETITKEMFKDLTSLISIDLGEFFVSFSC